MTFIYILQAKRIKDNCFTQLEKECDERKRLGTQLCGRTPALFSMPPIVDANANKVKTIFNSTLVVICNGPIKSV